VAENGGDDENVLELLAGCVEAREEVVEEANDIVKGLLKSSRPSLVPSRWRKALSASSSSEMLFQIGICGSLMRAVARRRHARSMSVR
jgi:hypothetical protein